MAGAAIWRMVSLDVGDRVGADLAISELALFERGQRVDGAASISCSHAPLDGVLSSLQDGATSSYVRFSAETVNSPGFFIAWTFPSVVDLDAIAVGAAALASEFLCGFSLEYFNGEKWVACYFLGRFLWPGANTLTAAAAFDPYFGMVRLLVRADGLNGSKSIIDSSSFGASLVPLGVTAISNAQAKFGGGSVYFGSSGDGHYLELANPSLLAFQSWDFTFECDCFFLTGSASENQLIYHNYIGDFANGAIYFGKHSSLAGKVSFWASNFGGTPLLTDPNLPPSNTWVHYAVCRKGSAFRLLRNGVVVASAVFAGAITGKTVPYGFFSTGYGSLRGYMDEIRVSIGVDRYDSFPPVRDKPYSPVQMADRRLGVGLWSSQGLLTSCVDFPVGMVAHRIEAAGLDVEFGGQGCIYGTVELYAKTGNIPLPRRVRLHRSRDGLLVRETWSDAQGQYRFDGISERYTYDVIAWDHEGLQQSVVANDLTPEVMP